MSTPIVQSTAISQTVREAFNFDVEKFPLSGPDVMKTPWYGLFRSDTGEVVGNGSVTKRYVPHTTDDVCALVDAASEAFDSPVAMKTFFRDGHHVIVQPTVAEREKIYGENDNVWPRILLNAAYDGRAFVACVGYFRDACRNMSIMKQVSGTSTRIRHTSGLRVHMDSLIAEFEKLKLGWQNMVDTIHALEATQVRMADFLDSIYGVPTPEQLALADSGKAVRAVTCHKTRTEAIWKRLNEERVKTGRPTLTDTVSAWEAYNGIQGYVQYDAQAKKGFKGEVDRILRASRDSFVLDAERKVLALVA